MGFLGNAKKSSPIVFAEFHIEVLPLDLDLLRFDNIVHVRAGVWQHASELGKQKIYLIFTLQKADIWPPASLTGGVCEVADPDRVSDRRSQNQFVA